MNLINFLLIILFLIIIVDSQTVCEMRDSCFDCLAAANCIWNNVNSICQSTPEIEDKIKWYLKYDQCERDSDSTRIMTEHCYGYGFNNLPSVATLLQVNNQFSQSNLYCKWVIEIADNTKPILLNITKSNESQLKKDKYVIRYLFVDNKESTSALESFSYYLKTSIVKQITFFYNSPEGPHLALPFELTVDYDHGMTVFDIVIIAVVVILVIIFAIILGITGYQCFKYIRLRKKRQHERANNVIVVMQQGDKDKKRKLNELLKQVPYKLSHQNNGTVCTICFEEFALDVNIVLLRCSHLFHFKCLTDYVAKAKLSPRCPNCNVDLVEVKNEGMEHIPINQINNAFGREFDNNNSNNDNRVQVYSGYYSNNLISPNSIPINNSPAIELAQIGNNDNDNNADNQ